LQEAVLTYAVTVYNK